MAGSRTGGRGGRRTRGMTDNCKVPRAGYFCQRMVPAEKIWQGKLHTRDVQGRQVRCVAEQAEIRNRIVPVRAAGHHDQQRECSQKQSEGTASVHRHLPALGQRNKVYRSFLSDGKTNRATVRLLPSANGAAQSTGPPLREPGRPWEQAASDPAFSRGCPAGRRFRTRGGHCAGSSSGR